MPDRLPTAPDDDPRPDEAAPDEAAPDETAPDKPGGDPAPEAEPLDDAALDDRSQQARRRLWDAFRNPTRAQIVVGVLLAVVGFGAVTQVSATLRDDSYATFREQDLIDVFTGLSAAQQRAEREIARLERTRQDLETNTRAREAALAQAESEADALSILAGVVPVSGPGIRITIEDPAGQVSIDSLLDLIQELRTAGAEAIELNDQVRVVAETSLEVGPDGVYVDGQQVSAPYVVDAIGDPATLAGAVDFFRGPLDTMEADEGAVVTVEERDTLDIESVREPAAP